MMLGKLLRGLFRTGATSPSQATRLARSTTLEVVTWLGPGDVMDVRFGSDAGKELGTLRGEVAPGQAPQKLGCRLSLPAGAGTLVLRGTANAPESERRRMKNWKFRIPLVDAAPLMGPLRQAGTDVGTRLARFAEAEREFAGEWDIPGRVALAPRAAPEAIEAAESRLGMRLPGELAALLRHSDGLELEGHRLLPARELDRLSRFLGQWNYAEQTLADLPAEVQRLYRESVVLFLENGDGVGALLVDREVFYWFHEERLANPLLLVDGDGRRMDFTQTFVWLMERFVLERHADALESGILVDSSAPVTTLRLRNLPKDYGSLSLRLEPVPAV
ncbi:SMI1/KNR4 family protein [Vitiosangium sp. GDMCC 1.1324]|uniref:SMI1/KNR4 family protein n=1 Tax=Vitiosangium sp. (strain GDMCC 1.1324) TaxID=2138576 RepID=UPI000D3855E9|nr:SMI1/KNR4 family protein [Vitiosangium sp. GDMCC 1.1324]PTL81784.1 hypothetical protein DAT35_22865 [Vitiosangium sp. GDMCC 1.1324]